MGILGWLRNLLTGERLRLKVSRTMLTLDALDKQLRKSKRDLTARAKELDLVREDLEEAESRLRETIDEALKIQKNYEEQLEAARSKLRIFEDVTVPTLIQQNRSLLEMWKAETDIHIRRQVAQLRKEDMDD